MSRYAFIVGVDYAESDFPGVPFAVEDAKGLSDILAKRGYDLSRQTLLVGQQATRTSIESRFRKVLKSLKADDELLFFFAGHAFTPTNEEPADPCLVASDSLADDLANTSVLLGTMLQALRASACPNVLFLMDTGTWEVPNNDDPEYVSHVHDAFEDFCNESPSAVCLFSCKPDESSHPSNTLGHRLWAWHLIEVLSGRHPEALNEKGCLTPASFQAFLEEELPRSLRKHISKPASQHPEVLGNEDYLIAEITEPVLGEGAQARKHFQQLRRLIFRARTAGRVKDLSGYQKGHWLPESFNAAAEKFVAKIVEGDLRTDIDEVYNSLREEFGFKRRDLEASVEKDGHAFIRSPLFDYNISATLNAEDVTAVVWQREIGNIRDQNVLMGEPFQRVFGNTFDTLVFEFEKPMDVEPMIDTLEDSEIEGMRLKIASDGSSCEITLKGFGGIITLGRDSLTIEGRGSQTATSLVQQFFEFQRMFGNVCDFGEK